MPVKRTYRTLSAMSTKVAFSMSTPRACANGGGHGIRHAAAICAIAASAAALVGATRVEAATGRVLSSNTELRRVVATDAVAILQHALPLPGELRGDGEPPVRILQTELEKLALSTRSRTGAARLLNGRASLVRLRNLLGTRRLDLLLDVRAPKRAEAALALANIESAVRDMGVAIGVPDVMASAPDAVESIFPPRVTALAGVFTSGDSGDAFDGAFFGVVCLRRED